MSREHGARDDTLVEAIALMSRFVERTRVGERPSGRRYLWTDAFAVCNCLAIAQRVDDPRFADLAGAIVDDVHYELGHHRADDGALWLDGANEDHPTRGGLRIGKPHAERGRDEPFDEYLEWERDGQYFHYLTKWMHALDQVARQRRRAHYNLWARELAMTAVRAFVYRTRAGAPRMYWKMSIDLSRPLVASMGQHDPLDGWLTCLQLHATASALGPGSEGPDLIDEGTLLARMVDRQNLATTDPLGLGGLLMEAARAAQLVAAGALDDATLVDDLVSGAHAGLGPFAAWHARAESPAQRLAFRELGLAIGMAGLDVIRGAISCAPTRFRAAPRLAQRLDNVARLAPLVDTIVATWRDPATRDNRIWDEHRDINEVMLASSLVPEGVLRLSVAA